MEGNIMKKLVSDKHRVIGSITTKFLSLFYRTKKKNTPVLFESLKNILVVDFFMIGDLVMGIPFYKTLRKQCPNAHITLVCQKWAGDIMREQETIDEIIEFDGKKILHDPIELIKNYSLFKRVVDLANRKKYDIAIEPRGDIRNIFLMRHINSEEYVSFNYSGGECMLSRVLIPDENIRHILDDKLNVLEQLGVKIEDKDRIPSLIIPDKLQKEAYEYISRLGINNGKRIIAINPGASLDIKRWKHFPELVEKICKKYGNEVVILSFGVEADKEILTDIVDIAKKNGVKAAVVIEKLPLYISLLSRCHYMLCNDSSAGHLAASFNIPVLVIFGPVEPDFAEPKSWNTVAVISKERNCKPCFMSNCPFGNECIEDITVEEVEDVFAQIYVD